MQRKGRFVGERLALGNLVLVVRKDEIGAATMNIDLVAESFANHGRALDMPARAPATPWTGPRRLTLPGPFPQRKVARVAFARLELFARGDQLRVQIPMAELAV